MNRRHFLLAATATAAFAPGMSHAAGFVTYRDGLIREALAAGQTVFVDYSATWCSTCKRQERVINALRAADPAYDAAMTFVKVDWDDFKSHPVTRARGIPRRSTLLVLRGEAELGRLVAGTSEADIKALMRKGL
ncbi:thioredoxin family protein [Sulfitobacter albidus]|uniref:Thioredoxin family protein n=1 Tax=Sulfitobacter albidus TaxID=2829501 RepID=A0A975PN88_9RHOB|nr:thioredoxin family protein [Sulfitobacter albidus]QUJ77211.1 thioredoxin family protein [Sulfitobacter albidus]